MIRKELEEVVAHYSNCSPKVLTPSRVLAAYLQRVLDSIPAEPVPGQSPAVPMVPLNVLEQSDAAHYANLSTQLAMLPGAPSIAAAVGWYITTHGAYQTAPDATVRPEHAGLGPVAKEIKAGRCFVAEPNLVFKIRDPYGISPTREEAMARGPERPDAPLPPPSLEAYAAVWNGLVALTLPGNPLAALNGVRMAEFPERLGEWVAGMEEYPYAHASELEGAVKGMLDAIAHDNARLVGVMYDAHERLKAAYNATPDGDVSPSLKEYANFWMKVRELLMQPGKPCHGLAMVPMADVPQAVHDFIAGLSEQVEMANARGHGLGLLAQRLTKKLGRGHASGVDAHGQPWVVGPTDLAKEEPVASGVTAIAQERADQMKRFGFAPAAPEALVRAARCYASEAVGITGTMKGHVPSEWPCPAEWWRPSTPIANLAKAGALIAAAIDVIQYRAVH